MAEMPIFGRIPRVAIANWEVLRNVKDVAKRVWGSRIRDYLLIEESNGVLS